MTQSLINQGKEGNSPSDNFEALPKWVCAEDFKARPENQSGNPRMELARAKCDGEQFLVIFDADKGTFIRRDDCTEYSPGALEIRIVEIL